MAPPESQKAPRASKMKLTSIITLAAFNVIAIAMAVGVAEDQAYRISYWKSMNFTPHTTYYPFFLITTATNGSTYIPGLLTLDWLQVLVVIIAVVDGWTIFSYVRQRNMAPQLVAAQKDQ